MKLTNKASGLKESAVKWIKNSEVDSQPEMLFSLRFQFYFSMEILSAETGMVNASVLRANPDIAVYADH